jgi:hypothetical protein
VSGIMIRWIYTDIESYRYKGLYISFLQNSLNEFILGRSCLSLHMLILTIYLSQTTQHSDEIFIAFGVHTKNCHMNLFFSVTFHCNTY